MSAQQRIKIPRLEDKTLIGCFKKLSELYEVESVNINALGFTTIGQVNIRQNISEDLQELLSFDSALIDIMSINIRGLNITFYRGGNYQPSEKSPYFDEIVITANQQQSTLDNKDKLKIIDIIIKDLKAFDPDRVVATPISPEQTHLIALHQSTLDRLEKLNEQLIQKGIEYRENIDRQFDKKIKEYEQNLEERKKELEEGYLKKLAELERREEEVAKKLKEIDDRDNTHVRRELRKALLDEVKGRFERFQLSDNTTKLRWPIHAVCILFFIIFSVGAIWYAKELFQYVSQEKHTTLGIIIISLKQLGFTSAGIATIVFYIHWLNKWFEQHASNEFKLRQFQLDIDRASWVVETALEWKRTLGTPIPSILLQSITKNLFEIAGESKSENYSPVSDFASAILGTSSKLRVKTGNAELEFDGKRLSKQIAKESKEVT